MTTQTYIASDGDTVESIAWSFYGTQDARVVEKLLNANPGLADIGPELTTGTTVLLPEISTTAEVQGTKLWG